jgi:hypothetical protein
MVVGWKKLVHDFELERRKVARRNFEKGFAFPIPGSTVINALEG